MAKKQKINYEDVEIRTIALLIKAAPKMLRELKRIHKMVEWDGGEISTVSGTIHSKSLKRIINEAEGKV